VPAVRRSAVLVRRKWFRVASIVGVGAALAIAGGPFVGAVLILLTEIPFTLLNVLAGVVYALTMPFVALATSYVYFDLRTRHELGETRDPEVLPAEIQLAG
jgi:ABC-type sulfate transport system permease subunit